MTTAARVLLAVAAAASAAAFTADAFYPFSDWNGVQPAATLHGVSAVLATLGAVLGARGAGALVAAASTVGAVIAITSVSVEAQGPGLVWSSASCAAISCGLALVFAMAPAVGSPAGAEGSAAGVPGSTRR